MSKGDGPGGESEQQRATSSHIHHMGERYMQPQWRVATRAATRVGETLRERSLRESEPPTQRWGGEADRTPQKGTATYSELHFILQSLFRDARVSA